MVQISMAGKDIRLAQRDRSFACGDVKLFAGLGSRKMLLKGAAESRRVADGNEDFPLFIYKLDRQADTCVKGICHGFDRLFRDNRIKCGFQKYHSFLTK